MSVNRYLPHVFVFPEDDANRQLANGFLLDSSLQARRIQVLPEAGGWTSALERFQSEHVAAMERYPKRFFVLLIDFDNQKEERFHKVRTAIPEHLSERVFILGVLSQPEALRTAIPDSYEAIGLRMAKDCREQTYTIWGHDLLRHNATELDRLAKCVRPILFESV